MNEFFRDDIFNRPQNVVDFRFDERTAAVFPDMIHRSIPAYASLLHMLGVIAGTYVQEGDHIYDLGCSLGGATLSLSRFIPKTAHITAVDSSPAMVQRFRAYVEGAALHHIEVLEADIIHLPLKSSRVIVMNFVLQFIPPPARDALIAKIYQALTEGGILLLAEKTQPEDDLLRTWHEAFKASQGYSALAIAQKREALENVMKIETETAERARLQAAGFRRVLPYFQGMMFKAWVAIK